MLTATEALLFYALQMGSELVYARWRGAFESAQRRLRRTTGIGFHGFFADTARA